MKLSGLLDPEVVAWELVPFSFVADWALPIGDYLSNRSFFKGLVGTYVLSVKSERSYRDPSIFGVTFTGHAQGNVSFTRTVSSSLNVGFPSIKPLSAISSWQHASNALALFDVVFRK